jgi:hypothetical protein
MTCKQRAIGIVLCCVVCAPPALAQTKVFVAGAVYESPDFVAPVAVLLVPAVESPSSGPSTIAWSAGLLGSTLTIDSVKLFSPRFGILAGASLTPFDAHASRWIYRNGKHETDLSFTDRSYQAKAGVRFQPTPAWRSDIQLLALKESVEGIDNHFWSHPYGGIEVTQSYRRVISEDLLQSRFDGFEATASAQNFFGSNTWSRFQVAAAGGKRIGNLFLRAQALAFSGQALNTVSQFIVGGSWDTSGGLPLYGFHYAQFRVARGVILNGGVDIGLPGAWEIGIRGGYLDSPGKSARGLAIRLGTMWNGIAWHLGAGLPGRVSGESKGGAFVFAGFMLAVIK